MRTSASSILHAVMKRLPRAELRYLAGPEDTMSCSTRRSKGLITSLATGVPGGATTPAAVSTRPALLRCKSCGPSACSRLSISASRDTSSDSGRGLTMSEHSPDTRYDKSRICSHDT